MFLWVWGGKELGKRVGLTLRLGKLTVRKKSLRLKNFLTQAQTFGGRIGGRARLDSTSSPSKRTKQ